MVLVATDEEEEELKQELLVTGLAIDVKSYKRIKRGDDSEVPQSGNNMGENSIISLKLSDLMIFSLADIALTSV